VIDFSSPAWHQIKKYAQQELERARIANDAQLSEAHTAALRGEIKALKKLLDLPNQARRAVVVESDL
jgi:hypothetical protein